MIKSSILATAILALRLAFSGAAPAELPVRPAAAQTATAKPNIVVITGDHIGWFIWARTTAA
jgi:hypothetical protein